MADGITPARLLAQVANTAAWALDGPVDGDAVVWRRALRHADAADDDAVAYLRLLLAAHFVTVATFVPTDVDARIRFHAWQGVRGKEALADAVRVIDETDAYDPRVVSARVVDTAHGAVSGHDGEWLAVRAGALGRAAEVGATTIADALVARIDAELRRETDAFADVATRSGREIDALRLATVLAHNVGDLSRVIEAWPERAAARAGGLVTRFVRLGHERAERFGGWFALAGRVNKAVMAVENHRFLALRAARCLRSARALLLPIGPFFDAWGACVGSHPSLDAAMRAEVLTALAEGHASDPTQFGWLRAMAGLHGASPGGLDALARDIPARLRKLVASGTVREAIRVDAERFEARMVKRYRAARA